MPNVMEICVKFHGFFPSSQMATGVEFHGFRILYVLPLTKLIVSFICLARNLRLKIIYFCTKLSSSRSLSTPQLWGCFGVVIVLFILRVIHLYLLGQWSTGLDLAKVRNTDNFGTEEVLRLRGGGGGVGNGCVYHM